MTKTPIHNPRKLPLLFHVVMGKKIGLTDPSQICKCMGATIFAAIGFGQMEIEKLTLNPPYAITHVYNSFECQLAPKTQTKPYSHFIRGIIAGYLVTVLGVKMKVEEIKCLQKAIKTAFLKLNQKIRLFYHIKSEINHFLGYIFKIKTILMLIIKNNDKNVKNLTSIQKADKT
jgi:hypothetical protein